MGRRRGERRRRRRRRDREEGDNDGGGPPSKHMETIVNYVTMATDISLKFDIILYVMRRFIGVENYKKVSDMGEKTGIKEMIKVLQEKEPENCSQILVDVLVECKCLKNTGWKEKPDPISALLFELREPISVIERLMESVKEGDVDKVKQLLSQYPIRQDMEHITRECCVLSLERRDLTLVKFLYQDYSNILDNERTLKHILNEAVRLDFAEGAQFLLSQGLPPEENTFYILYNKLILEHILTEAVRVDFTEGVQFLFSQGLPPAGNIFYIVLLEEAKSVDMLRLLLSEKMIRKSLNHEPRFSRSVFYHQILNSSTQEDCMRHVQILVDAGARVENLIDKTKRRAWLKIIKERWFQVFDCLLNQLKYINFTNRYHANILHVILVRDKDGDREDDGDVRNNILDFVTNLVERGIDINSVDGFGDSPLMLSCRAGYYDVVKYLIETGADVDNVDNDGDGAIIVACKKGYKDIVEYFIQHGGADVNKVDNKGQTMLMLACKKGHKDIVEHLIQQCRADVNKGDNDGRTALMWASRGGNKDVVEYLIQHGGADVKKVDNDRKTALLWACDGGHYDVVKYLIERGADVNKEDNDGVTSLMLTCEEGHKDVVEYLIQHGGADVNKGGDNGLTALMRACAKGYKDLVEYLIQDCGADVNKVDNDGHTALIFACTKGHKDVVEYLIQHGGADVNNVGNDGHTALMFACYNGNKDIVEYLIQDCGADVNTVDNDGHTALMIACTKGYKHIVEYLIQHGGADVNNVGNDGHTALMFACYNGNKDIVDYLIQHGGVDVNMVDFGGRTVLMLTCEEGNKDVVEYLTQYGRADVNKGDNHGMTALMLACKKGHIDIVEYLIEHGGANVDNIDFYGQTALMWACKRGHKDIVEYLIQHGGVHVYKVDVYGRTTLMLACQGGNKDVVEYLIQHGGADVNKVNNDGMTVLMLACTKGHIDIVEYLIQHGGVDVYKVDVYGRTTLMLACENGNKDVVEYLIKHGGADVNKVDYRGQTALMSACYFGHKDIVEYLIQHGGADVNKGDVYGKTALMWACKGGNKDVVEYLIQHCGAYVNKVDLYGRTTLMYACMGGHKDVVEYLIQHGGADVNMVNSYGRTSLYYCLSNLPFLSKSTHREVNALFKFLVESGADLSLPSNGVRLFEKILERKLHELFLFVISLKPKIVDVTDKGENILHLLAKVNYEFTVGHFGWLFDCHVDINHKNRHTDTPLMVAAMLLNEKYLEVFTHHPDVDLNTQNKRGYTALHCLILGFTELIQGFRRRHNEGIAQNYCQQFYPMYTRCVDSLLGAGTDVNVQDNKGRTVLMMAVRENDRQLVRKLLDAGAMVDKVDRSGRHALHYVDFSDSVYDLTIFFLIFPSRENHLLDLPCIHGNTLIQTVLQFPPWWEPCKVVAFVRWLVFRNCSLRHLRGRTGHSTYNQLSLDDFSCSQRQNLRELLYRSGAPKEEIISTVNFQAEDEAENEIFHSRNGENFEKFCLNVSLRSMCIRVLRQFLGTEIRARLPELGIPRIVKKSLLLEDVVRDGDDGVLGGFDELEDESDSCSYIVNKDREYFHYLDDGTRDRRKTYRDDGVLGGFDDLRGFGGHGKLDFRLLVRFNFLFLGHRTRDGRRSYSYRYDNLKEYNVFDSDDDDSDDDICDRDRRRLYSYYELNDDD